MKKVVKALIIVLFPLLLVSCGGSSSGDLVGTWHVDVSSLDLVLGDGIPDAMKSGIESQKGTMMEKAQAESDKVSIEFTEDGKMKLSAEGEDENPELNYSVSGGKLVITGEHKGQKINFSLTLSTSADKFTLSITGEDVLSQMETEYPELLAQAKGMDLKGMAKGTSVSISFKK